MRNPRVGHIDFLNVLPLSVHYAQGVEGMDVVRGVPAELNDAMRKGTLDVSNVSSILYAKEAENFVVLPEVCVSTDGAVQSILLVSKKPIRALNGEKIALTAKSETSHALLKIILQEGYEQSPLYEVRTLALEAPVPEEMAAALFIGDDALYLHYHRQDNLYYYDLGAEWKKLTGKKMVYALWVANKKYAEAHGKELAHVFSCVKRGLRPTEQELEDAIASVGDIKPFRRTELRAYLGAIIRWRLEPNYLEGLKEFYRLAEKCKLIEHVPAIVFAKIDI